MRVILTIILSSFLATTYGQLKPEDVFLTGEHFNKDKCRIETNPDWGRLVILSNKRFCSFNFIKDKNNRDTLYLIGNYKVSNDTLYLSSVESAEPLAKLNANDTKTSETQPDVEWIKMIFPDVKFKITKCDNGQLLLVSFAGNRYWYGVKDADGGNVVRKMKEDGQWENLLR